MKIIIIILFLFITNNSFADHEPKKVLIILNEGFQIDEYFTPKKLFMDQGYQIVTASRYGGLVKPGKKYILDSNLVQTDLSFDQVKLDGYNAIAFVGGGGAWSDYFPNKKLHEILMQAVRKKEMIVGLICAATGLLATVNNLDGSSPQFKNRMVTGYQEVEGMLKFLGKVQYIGGDPEKPFVVEDGSLITARDPGSSKLFAETMIKRINLIKN